MKPKATFKRDGQGFEMRTVEGKTSDYLVFKTRDGEYHVFAEVEAKEASRDCGAPERANTQLMWDEIWKKKR